MRRLRVVTALVVALFGLTLGVWAAPTLAYACSCAQPDPAAQANRADVIFTGTVVSDEVRGDTRRLSFAVDRVYKGSAASTQVVETSSSGASCGLEVSGPGPFVVYAQAGGGRPELTSGLCDGTTNAPAPAALGEGTPPTPVEEPMFSSSDQAVGVHRHRRGLPGLRPVPLPETAAGRLITPAGTPNRAGRAHPR